MNSSVQRPGRAAPTSVKTRAGVCPRRSCATGKATVWTAVMKITVVGPTFDKMCIYCFPERNARCPRIRIWTPLGVSLVTVPFI